MGSSFKGIPGCWTRHWIRGHNKTSVHVTYHGLATVWVPGWLNIGDHVSSFVVNDTFFEEKYTYDCPGNRCKISGHFEPLQTVRVTITIMFGMATNKPVPKDECKDC